VTQTEPKPQHQSLCRDNEYRFPRYLGRPHSIFTPPLPPEHPYWSLPSGSWSSDTHLPSKLLLRCSSKQTAGSETSIVLFQSQTPKHSGSRNFEECHSQPVMLPNPVIEDLELVPCDIFQFVSSLRVSASPFNWALPGIKLESMRAVDRTIKRHRAGNLLVSRARRGISLRWLESLLEELSSSWVVARSETPKNSLSEYSMA